MWEASTDVPDDHSGRLLNCLTQAPTIDKSRRRHLDACAILMLFTSSYWTIAKPSTYLSWSRPLPGGLRLLTLKIRLTLPSLPRWRHSQLNFTGPTIRPRVGHDEC